MYQFVLQSIVYITSIALVVDAGLFGNSQQQPIDKYLIGVHPDQLSLYQLKSEQKFRCLDGSTTIPSEFVNDDYCDCHDASDEPGTSACGHGKFFCKNEGYVQKFIPSAWVNDEQCDCCDASDEYNSSVTCENTCGILGELYRQEQERVREISDKGSTIRQQYKEQARMKREENTQLLEQYKREVTERGNAIKRIEEELNSDFGPSSVFFPLKGQCYQHKDREYTYTLCPFERATQESTSGLQTELGRWAGWSETNGNQYSRQKYEGGVQCWNGPARSALVNIACGTEDKVISVSEPAKCEYVFEFITPAACPDLDPPEVQQQSGGPPDSGLEIESTIPEGEQQQIVGEEPPGLEPDEQAEISEVHDEL